jgi:serine/threonine-protein kinase
MGGVPAGAGSLVGQRLGKYQLLALLALGGTAEIYLARIEGTSGFEKYVVVKCLHDHLADDQEFVHMFLDEARLGATLDHSNIVQTLELGEQNGRYYMAMEFLAGMSLAMVARKAVERVPGGKIPVHLTLGLAAQACAGLHYAHERQSGGKPLNIVHRDISPQNLVITFEGVVKIVDFGIARAEHRETHTRAGTIKGKFAYMSPEQCRAAEVDRRTDVFALGTIVHELITGRRLFKKGSTYDTYQAILEGKVPVPSSVNHELDPGLDPVVMKALAYDREDRYPTAEAFGEALIGYLHHRGKHSGPGEVSKLFDQYYLEEIDEHGARMRELLEGREHATSLLTWDAEALSDIASRMPDDQVDPVSLDSSDVMLEQSVSRVKEVSEISGLEVVSTISDVSDQPTYDEAPDSDSDEEGGEKTRIEENPFARVEELHRSQPVSEDGPTFGLPGRQMPAALPAIPRAAPAPAGKHGAAKLGPMDRTDPDMAVSPTAAHGPQGKRRNAPGTSPPQTGMPSQMAMPAVTAPRASAPAPRPLTAPPVLRPPAGYMSPAADVPTVIDQPAVPAGVEVPTVIEPVSQGRGFVAAPNVRTMIHDPNAPAVQASLTPPHVQSVVPPPSANPAGAMAHAELPLPAHLIGLPPIEQVFNTNELAAIEQRAKKFPPWLLVVFFVAAVSVALGLTIAIGRALR